MDEFSGTFMGEKTIKRLTENISITPKQQSKASEWLDMMEKGELEGETKQYINFANIILNDILGYDSKKVIHNTSGKAEITVVNIHKFKDDPDVVKNTDYNLDIQRVFFLDEVHRSYNPKGSFLANLEQSDRNSIKIGLTGTPLLGTEYNSKTLFGDYIH
jgi:type I site-specific restriction-modification system R (restriction) subunit